MNYKEVNGDVIELFYTDKGDSALLHGANCQRVMGAGIAAQIRDKVQPLFYIDQFDLRTPAQRFGSFSAVTFAGQEGTIKAGINLYTQFLTGANFDITAFRNALKAFVFSIPLVKQKDITIYLPKIGCGIGGAKWEDVEPVVKEELTAFNVIVVNYTGKGLKQQMDEGTIPPIEKLEK